MTDSDRTDEMDLKNKGSLIQRSLTAATSGDKQVFRPTVIMDGSKLILKLGNHERFQIDGGVKIMLTSEKVKLENVSSSVTQGICNDDENMIVVDSGGRGLRFVPIPLAHYGTVYTRDGAAHVMVGRDIRRAKISCRNLPYRTCTKFAGQFVDVADDEQFLLTRNTSRVLEEANPKEAIELMKKMASDPSSGVVYVRADDSIARLKLKSGDRFDIHSGCRVVAWTLGIRFEYRSVCCFRVVTAVVGEGTVWVHNPKQRVLQ